MKYNPLNDEFSSVELIASTQLVSGADPDIMPVISARVSHAGDNSVGDKPSEKDLALMKYLAENHHMTPFEHQSSTFKIVCPLFIAREWHRHRTQSYNEISMRYTSDPVGKIWMPEEFREQASRNKQSSAGPIEDQETARKLVEHSHRTAIKCYNMLVDMGVAREHARAVIPVANYTEFYASANLRNWAHFAELRLDKNAQYEIRMYAQAIDSILSEIFPKSWGALKASLNYNE